MIFENPFTIPTFRILENRKLNFMDITSDKELNREIPIDTEVIDESNHVALLTLPLKNKPLDYLVVGDVFYHKEKKAFFVFMALTKNDAIKDVGFIYLDENNMNLLNNKITGMKDNNIYTNNLDISRMFVDYIYSDKTPKLLYNINEVNLSELSFLSNLFYHDEFEDKIMEIFDNELYYNIFKSLDIPFSYIVDFRLLLIENDIEFVNESTFDSSTYKFLFELVDSWSPLVYLTVKIDGYFEKQKLYLNDIFLMKKSNKNINEGIVIFDKDDYTFKIILSNNKELNIETDELESPINDMYADIFHMVEDTDEKTKKELYEKYSLLFI